MHDDKIKLDLNMSEENPTKITWQPSGGSIIIKMANRDVDIAIEMGEEVIRQLKQALYWTPDRKSA